MAGQTELGLDLLDGALAIARKTGNRNKDAEVHRLKRELLLIRPQDVVNRPNAANAEADAYFRQTIDIARRQQATSFELRVTKSLCRLWQAQGKGAEAYALLAEIYGWFSEGFDTGDLIEAKALLQDLL